MSCSSIPLSKRPVLATRISNGWKDICESMGITINQITTGLPYGHTPHDCAVRLFKIMSDGRYSLKRLRWALIDHGYLDVVAKYSFLRDGMDQEEQNMYKERHDIILRNDLN